MSEFTSQIEAYKDYINMYGVPGAEVPNTAVAEKYLRMYGLLDNSYQREWQHLHHSVFDPSRQLPEMIFKKDFEFISLLGGVTFEQTDFEQLQSCLQQVGEENLLIVQDTWGMSPDQNQRAFKMKYALPIGWDKLMSGNFISTALFEASESNYYIFGSTGEWGMYVATEFVDNAVDPAGTPIRIIGFDPKHRMIFRGAFGIPEYEYCENVDYIPEDERPNLRAWVPEIYRT